MPSRWWVPVTGVRPDLVKLDFVHAAVSAWFDLSPGEHTAREKPYAVSPPASEGQIVGLEVGVLTSEMEKRLLDHAVAGERIRLGNQFGTVGRPRRIAEQSWQKLAGCIHDRTWELAFATPTTFRRRDRSSPLPAPVTVLRGLSVSWSTWSDVGPRALARADADQVWVSELDLRSHEVSVSGLTVQAALGRVRYRCDDPRVAAQVGPLFRLAPYSGVGALRSKGFGVTRLTTSARATGRRPERRSGGASG